MLNPNAVWRSGQYFTWVCFECMKLLHIVPSHNLNFDLMACFLLIYVSLLKDPWNELNYSNLFFLVDNSDLIACMVVSKDGVQAQRFLSVDVYQMSLVEPDSKRLGWGVVKFAGLLQVGFIPTPTLQTWHRNKQKKSTFGRILVRMWASAQRGKSDCKVNACNKGGY